MMANSDAVEDFGCPRCWPRDAVAAWDARRGLGRAAELVDESHFHVLILSCPQCAQHFLSVFTETVDWADGEDPQFWKVVPLETAEVAALTAPGASPVEAELQAVAGERRCLARDYPKGASAPTVRWTRGLRIGLHD